MVGRVNAVSVVAVYFGGYNSKGVAGKYPINGREFVGLTKSVEGAFVPTCRVNLPVNIQKRGVDGQLAIGGGVFVCVEVACDEDGMRFRGLREPCLKQSRGTSDGGQRVVKMGVEKEEFPPRGEVDELCPGGCAWKCGIPTDASGNVRRVAQPETPLLDEPECRFFEEDRRHFERGDAPAPARDAVKLVFWQVFTDEFSLGVVAAFLQTEQVGVAGANALEDEEFTVVPAISPIVCQSVADVEGHEI